MLHLYVYPSGYNCCTDGIYQRVILLDKVFDFTSYYGTTSGEICKPWTCDSNKVQLAINANKYGLPSLISSRKLMRNSWCSSSYAKSKATWNVAGASKALKVSSNKTLLGKGAMGGL